MTNVKPPARQQTVWLPASYTAHLNMTRRDLPRGHLSRMCSGPHPAKMPNRIWTLRLLGVAEAEDRLTMFTKLEAPLDMQEQIGNI